MESYSVALAATLERERELKQPSWAAGVGERLLAISHATCNSDALFVEERWRKRGDIQFFPLHAPQFFFKKTERSRRGQHTTATRTSHPLQLAAALTYTQALHKNTYTWQEKHYCTLQEKC
jgi:hypothetical protein